MYIAVDGDAVGKKLEQLILEENPKALLSFSQTVQDTINDIKKLIIDNQGKICMCGGDNIMAACDQECAEIVTKYVIQENESNQIYYSVAVGETMQDTYLALKYAKSSKKHYIEIQREGEDVKFISLN